MKIVLVKPAASLCEECCCGQEQQKVLPAQILLTSAFLQKHGFDVEVNDLQVQSESRWQDADVCVFWISVPEMLFDEMSLVSKAKDMGKTTVVVPNDSLGFDLNIMHDFPYIDFLLRLHEREQSLLELFQQMQQPKPVYRITGVVFRDGEQIVDGGQRQPSANLKHIGNAVEVYKHLPLSRYQRAFVQTGKGCPYACTFCSFQKTKPRKRRITDVVREIEYLSRYFKVIDILDLYLAADRGWALAFLHSLAKLKLRCRFTADCRIEDFHDEELSRAFKHAGFVLLLAGMEHIAAPILQSIKKPFDRGYVREGICRCQSMGIMPSLSFMVGFPEESYETLGELEDFIKKPPYFVFDVNPIILNCETPLYQRYEEEGLLDSTTLADTVFTNRKPPYHSRYLSSAEIALAGHKLNGLKRSFGYQVRHKLFRLRTLL